METTRNRTGNALKKPFEWSVSATTTATPKEVYAALADLQAHLSWGAGKNGLTSLSAPPGPASVGTEWTSTGNDPMGPFQDRSVVTEARPGELFEFVTDAHQNWKKGEPVDWTVVHRYSVVPSGRGSAITYTPKITRLSRTPGPLRMMNSRLFGRVFRRLMIKYTQKTLTSLTAFVETN